MGKGDKRSKRGKIWRKTHGKNRPTEQKQRAKKRKAGLPTRP